MKPDFHEKVLAACLLMMSLAVSSVIVIHAISDFYHTQPTFNFPIIKK